MSKIIQGELCIYVDDLRLKNNHVLEKELLHKFFNPNQAKASTSHKYYSIAIGSVQLVLFAIIAIMLN